MKKLLALLLCLFPSIVGAQTATGRIAASGQSTFDSIANTQTVTMVGATPSVGLGNVFKTANVGATNVTNFLNAHDSQVIQVNCGDTLTTIVNGATIITSTGSNITCTLNSVYTFIFDAAQNAWVQTKSVGSGGGSSVGNQFLVQTSNGAGGFTAGGASDNASVFHAAEDLQVKGPNPTYDIRDYGGYGSATSTAPTMTCSITATSTTLSCVSNPDFQNLQGVVVPLAGAATALTTPGQATVTPNLNNGATTYSYQLIAEDRLGGLTAASTAGSTTIGSAVLGLNTITLTQCVIASNVATYTSSGAHNLKLGDAIDVEGFTGTFGDPCNGAKTVVTVPTGTTFTVNVSGGTETNTTGTPTAKVMACNVLTFPASSLSGGGTLRYWIYRNSALVGVAPGIDPFYKDCGATTSIAPNYIPSTPPVATQPGYLVSTIVSGGGTTTLTLANAAGTTATSKVVLHDNSLPLKNAMQAAYNGAGGTVYVPTTPATPWWIWNGTTNFTTGFTNVFQGSVRIHLNGSFIILNQPWILRSAMEIEGEPKQTSAFMYVNAAHIAGSATPMMMMSEVDGNAGARLTRLYFSAAGTGQTALMTDSGTDGGGVTGVLLDDVTVNGNADSRPVIFKGGFDYYWNNRFHAGGCFNQEGTFKDTYCVEFTMASPAVTGANVPQLPGLVKFDGVYFAGGGILFNYQPNTNGQLVSSLYRFSGSLFESVITPYIKVNVPTTNSYIEDVWITDIDTADNISAFPTPLVDASLGGLRQITFQGITPQVNSTPLVIGTGGVDPITQTNALLIGRPGGTTGNVSNFTFIGSSLNFGQWSGRVFQALVAPAAPSLVVSAGGAVPVGMIPYQAVAIDIDGNETGLGAIANAVTTPGNQTVTITPPVLPSGSIGWRPYRQQSRANIQTLVGSCSNFITAGVPFVDNVSFTCGASQVTESFAGQSVLGPNGISTPFFRLMNTGFAVTSTFLNPLTASRARYVPDVTGMNVVTSNPNSYYDNFTRANGGLGSAWTATNQTLLIVSNAVPGVITNQYATSTFNASSTLAPDQFCQLTITVYNSTTDAPGCALRMSGFVFYGVEFSTSGWQIIKRTAQFSQSILASGALTGTPGDVLRFEISGSMLSAFQNGTLLGTATDASLTTGLSGIAIFGNVATVDNFSTGNLHPLTHLDIEQDVIQPQHFYKGLTVGATTNPALARYGRYTTTLTPASVAANTCAAQSFTVTGALAADILIGVNKPTEQAGLSVTPGHVSAANTATLNFCNNTAAPITPTASEVYNFVVVQ